MNDNKDVKLLRDKLKIEVEVVVIKKSQVVEGAILLDKIRRNQTKEQKV